MRLIQRIGNWFDARLQLAAPIRETMQHPIPRDTASWAYVFGSAAMTAFGLQLVTGILLALIYAPSAGEAWNSLQILNHEISLGWFVRALHGWGSNFIVAIVLIHMVQVFLFGAYKFPRELTWTLGIFLLLMTLGMAFTGQVLRFDQDAYWGLGLGASIVSRVPILGPALVVADDGRADYRGRNAVAILRAACVRDPRSAHTLRCIACADGGEARHQ
jgi:ubiquinol-cytochrome c reductase cytochrome b subunit